MSGTIYNIDELAKIVNEIVAPYPVRKVTLVGSYANNTASETSDIDLVLEGDNLSEAYWDILFQLEDTLNVPVDIITERGLRSSILRDSVMSGGISLYEA